jgi:DNA-binding NarL/FixJ family response regulator
MIKDDLNPKYKKYCSQYQITQNQFNVMVEYLKGKNKHKIAEERGVSHNTISTQIQKIYKKYDVKSRIELMNKNKDLIENEGENLGLKNYQDFWREVRLAEIGLQITNKKYAIIQKILEGKNREKTAEELGIKVNTVKTHLKEIYKKFGARNIDELIHSIEKYL